MDDLIKRLSEATGPDRELDNLIALAAGYTIAQKCMPHAPDTYFAPKQKYIGVAPRFTESIDAALTLVPEDGWLNIGHRRNNRETRIGDGERFIHAGFELGRMPFYSGAQHPTSIAIALVIAALRARQARE